MVHDKELESKRKKTGDINGLVDEMLVEILSRLPCHKSVVICKAVCKHWASLISHPFFIERFVTCRNGPYTSKTGEDTMKMMNDQRFGRVVRKMDMPVFGHDTSGGNTYDALMICFNDPIHNPKNVSVSYLPRLSNSLPETLTVVGACNDLLLHRKYESWFSFPRLDLYISNAQTRQWVELPPLYLQGIAQHIGLICDPYYSNHTTNFTLNDAYRACIVVIVRPLINPTAVTEFSAHILSPNTGGIWRNVVLSLPLSCEHAHFSSYFCFGRKYYFRCRTCIIGFDPFVDDDNGVIKCDYLHLPLPTINPISTFGVFDKQLYLCHLGSSNGDYRVWALEDYETSCWSLRHSITKDDWIPRNNILVSLINRDSHIGKPISFHPTNPDIIYMLSSHQIILCNLRTREIEVASKLPQGSHVFFFEACPFQITLPIWPSPLPTLGF